MLLNKKVLATEVDVSKETCGICLYTQKEVLHIIYVMKHKLRNNQIQHQTLQFLTPNPINKLKHF